MADLAELEARIKTLEDIEAIKRLKARYWRCMDKKLWSELEEVFAKDAILDYGDNHVEGAKAIVEGLKGHIGNVATAHGGHSPEIEITGNTTARGTWALEDYLVWESGRKLVGFGHYQDEYVKQTKTWKIKSTRLTRLFEEWAMTKRA